MLEKETGEKVIVPRHPQLMGAYGAALIALGIELADSRACRNSLAEDQIWAE